MDRVVQDPHLNSFIAVFHLYFHDHDAGVDRGDVGIFRCEYVGVALGIRRRRKGHFRPVAHDDVTPMLSFPFDGGVVNGRFAHTATPTCP